MAADHTTELNEDLRQFQAERDNIRNIVGQIGGVVSLKLLHEIEGRQKTGAGVNPDAGGSHEEHGQNPSKAPKNADG